jgi:hypothetical protein
MALSFQEPVHRKRLSNAIMSVLAAVGIPNNLAHIAATVAQITTPTSTSLQMRELALQRQHT